jgi:hypothetical protein
VFTIGDWQPGIGDPSLVGWFIVGSYYLCAGVSLAWVLKARARVEGTDRRFRMLITLVVLVLGLSKQFNLPGAVTEMGRMLAYQSGRYEGRRWPQVFMMSLVAIGFVLFIRWWAKQKTFIEIRERASPELICLLCLCSLVILRAISLHHVGALLSAEVFGVRLGWMVELAGIYALVVILLVRIRAKTPAGTGQQVGRTG